MGSVGSVGGRGLRAWSCRGPGSADAQRTPTISPHHGERAVSPQLGERCDTQRKCPRTVPSPSVPALDLSDAHPLHDGGGGGTQRGGHHLAHAASRYRAQNTPPASRHPLNGPYGATPTGGLVSMPSCGPTWSAVRVNVTRVVRASNRGETVLSYAVTISVAASSQPRPQKGLASRPGPLVRWIVHVLPGDLTGIASTTPSSPKTSFPTSFAHPQTRGLAV